MRLSKSTYCWIQVQLSCWGLRTLIKVQTVLAWQCWNFNSQPSDQQTKALNTEAPLCTPHLTQRAVTELRYHLISHENFHLLTASLNPNSPNSSLRQLGLWNLASPWERAKPQRRQSIMAYTPLSVHYSVLIIYAITMQTRTQLSPQLCECNVLKSHRSL